MGSNRRRTMQWSLDIKFAYATNGQDIIEIDFFTGKETEREGFPTPDELWRRQREGFGSLTISLQSECSHQRGLIPENRSVTIKNLR